MLSNTQLVAHQGDGGVSTKPVHMPLPVLDEDSFVQPLEVFFELDAPVSSGDDLPFDRGQPLLRPLQTS